MKPFAVRGKCTDVSSEGKGVVKSPQGLIFVDGLFPGEEADIDVLYQRAGVYFGKVKKLYKLSPDRIQPQCRICTSCGGCQYQQLRYGAQLFVKTQRVVNALMRIAHLQSVKVLPCIGMKDPYHYRNKIQVPFAKDKKGAVIYGFFKENTHEIIINKECVIEDLKAAPILWDIKNLIQKYRISVYREDDNEGVLRYVLIRTSLHYPHLMVVLVTTQMNFPGQRNFVKDLISLHPEITTVVENVNTRKTNVILGNREKVLYGKGYIVDDILGLSFHISASSFFQVNPVQVEVLYNCVLSLIGDDASQVVLDAYSGVGTIGLLIAPKVSKVISVEINRQAHLNALENAKNNHIDNIDFYQDDAGQFIQKYIGRIDVVVMDPPRKGSDKSFLLTLLKKKPTKIIYISCHPETLARDIEILKEKYEVTYVQPVDMFPFTSHVETVVLLTKIKDK